MQLLCFGCLRIGNKEEKDLQKEERVYVCK